MEPQLTHAWAYNRIADSNMQYIEGLSLVTESFTGSRIAGSRLLLI